MTYRQHDIGALIKTVHALNPNVVTAGTGGDGAAQNGENIDRLALNSSYLSGKVCVPYKAVMAAAKTGTLVLKFQHGHTATSYVDMADKNGATAVNTTIGSTGATAPQTIESVAEMDVDFAAARRYMRIKVTPTLSATATDTLAIAGVLVLGGADTYPAP